MTFFFFLLKAYLLQKWPYKSRSTVTFISITIEVQWNPVEICSDYGWFAFAQLSLLDRCYRSVMTSLQSCPPGLGSWYQVKPGSESSVLNLEYSESGDKRDFLVCKSRNLGSCQSQKSQVKPRKDSYSKLFQYLSSSLIHIQYIDDILDEPLESVTRQGLNKSTICPEEWIIPPVWRGRRGQSDKREHGRDGQWSMMPRQEH